jgi:hypothetical protein
MLATIVRLIREERGDMQFLYASLAVFAALAVAAGEGLTESATTWLTVVRGYIGL